jgi:uncharacterized membrane protein (UPF0127 family)
MFKLLNLNYLLVALCLVHAGCGPQQKSAETPSKTDAGLRLETEQELTFLTQDGQLKTSIEVAVADQPEERNQGLMNVKSMPASSGMLFIFEQEQPLSFWMANTYLSLDILFANADSIITHIHPNTQPLSPNQYGTDGQPGRFVVEVNAGFCTLNDIKVGDRIRF